MVNCMLCPKKGGAMKPTNIFTSIENYRKYNPNISANKKPQKKHHHHQYTKCSSEPLMIDEVSDKKIILGENEDKNLSLGVILKREFDFQSDIRAVLEKNKNS